MRILLFAFILGLALQAMAFLVPTVLNKDGTKIEKPPFKSKLFKREDPPYILPWEYMQKVRTEQSTLPWPCKKKKWYCTEVNSWAKQCKTPKCAAKVDIKPEHPFDRFLIDRPLIYFAEEQCGPNARLTQFNPQYFSINDTEQCVEVYDKQAGSMYLALPFNYVRNRVVDPFVPMACVMYAEPRCKGGQSEMNMLRHTDQCIDARGGKFSSVKCWRPDWVTADMAIPEELNTWLRTYDQGKQG